MTSRPARGDPRQDGEALRSGTKQRVARPKSGWRVGASLGAEVGRRGTEPERREHTQAGGRRGRRLRGRGGGGAGVVEVARVSLRDAERDPWGRGRRGGVTWAWEGPWRWGSTERVTVGVTTEEEL